jgi:hypothetical protein
MITTLMGLLTALSAALVFFGGALFAYGMLPLSYIVTAIGAGWLGIIYSSLLRWLKKP